ncbi:segregation/condensation protein A [Candidatus Sumerlaeota bacterium]|nr:segregation/condensation protein A [Candidatus Sumerlaeota bacterium]
MSEYKIQLPFFTGPFDLLLSLIKANEMDIYDVRIAEVVDQYLAYIELMQLCDLELAGEFLDMAATLVRLKSRTLLPQSPYDKEEDEELEEEVSELQSAKELIEQLVEYRKYKELSVPLSELEERQAQVHFRSKIGPLADSDVGSQEEISGDLALLLKALSRVIKVLDTQRMHKIVRETWTVEEKMQDVLERLRESETLDVTRLFMNCIHKIELITVFLAVLELCKRRRIGIRQSANFDRIEVYKREEQLDYVGPQASEE